MEREQLRAIQAPLKERYNANPDAALITLSANGELGEGVATSLGISISSGRVHAEGDLDFRGTLGVDREAPVGFRAIRLSFDLDTDADAQQLAALERLTERYCVVYQSLASAPSLSTTLNASG